MTRGAIVFGASGQLGAAVAERLWKAGWRVAAVSRDGREPPFGEGIDGTGRTRAGVLRDFGPVDGVFDPTAYDDTDAADLLSARDCFGAAVVVSSASVYADAQGRSLDEARQTGFPRFQGPIGEDTPTVPPGPETYSTRKVAMEQAFARSGAPVTVLRPCAVYGRLARHPREWWFLKRALDGRRQIPVCYGARSMFHTSSAAGIAGLASLALEQPCLRVLNVADAEALTVADIAAVLSRITGLDLPLRPYEGPPPLPAYVGSTPWSTERPFVLDLSRAKALGWMPSHYAEDMPEVCDWVLRVARDGDWRARFTRFSQYGYDPFDYDAEDRFLTMAQPEG